MSSNSCKNMTMSDLEKALVDKIAEEMMVRNGHQKPTGKHAYDLEWDLDVPDSQHSIIHDDVEWVTNQIFSFLRSEDVPEEEEQVEAHQSPAVTTSNAIFIFLKNPQPGIPFYVSDVREWLSRVDLAGIPDDTEVEGALYLSYDMAEEEGDFVLHDRITCAECGAEDLLVATHDCPAQHS